MLLQDKLLNYRLLLASSSPRRKEILISAGLPFELAELYEVDEIWPDDMPAERVAEYLSELKSESFPRPLMAREILLTADTTVVLDALVLGKPRDESDARAMLRSLAGRSHRVITGVTIRTSANKLTFSAESIVWFRELTNEEIDHYVTSFLPLDKAGAYAIQEWIGHIGIERIEGSFYNVMGLPIQLIYKLLNEII